VPFTVTIPADDRDHELAEKLIPEYGGILAWAIRGCLAWQSMGLFPPQSVREATEDYFEAEDAIGRWIEERCVLSRNLTATTNDLFASFKAWAEANGEEISSQKGLVEVLEGRGCRSARNVGPRRVRGVAGIGLTAEEARKGWSDRSA
jgi:putative DNA primase/helicase